MALVADEGTASKGSGEGLQMRIRKAVIAGDEPLPVSGRTHRALLEAGCQKMAREFLARGRTHHMQEVAFRQGFQPDRLAL